MMRKWLHFMTPSQGHKRLAALAGSWDVLSRSWWEGAGKPPVESKGTAEVQWILGGRYLQMNYRSEMMGMPLEGIGVLGYDNFNRKYVMSWIDNMGTALSTAEGTCDTAGTIFTLFGKMDEPLTDEHDKTAMYVYRILGPNTYAFEIHDMSLPEGTTKAVELIYTRKAK